MNIVDQFLNALQNKIEANKTQINDFETKQNQKIKIKIILYTHSILDNEIKYEDLISFSDDEIKEIFASLDNTKTDILFKTYSVYKPLVEMYKKIKDKYVESFEAPQYTEASKWLYDILKRINDYLNNEQKTNSEYINSLKQKNYFYNKYFELFNGNKLIKPIEDLKEFSKLLTELNFNNKELYEIKKFIGTSHIKLLSIHYNNALLYELDKYKVILKSKKEKYHDLYQQLIKEDNISINSNLDKLAKKYQTNTYNILQTISAILLERELNNITKETKLSQVILRLEEILDYSHSLEPQEEITIEIDENEKVLNEAKNILKQEKDLVNNINEEEFSQYLLESIYNDSKEYLKYQIISILLELYTEIEKYNNVQDVENDRNIVINNIKDYIETYKKLKEKNK